MPRRSTQGAKGRVALLHSLAHIELNAVDMTWDLIGRFRHVPMPLSYYDNWVQVGLEEAKHFELVSRRLAELGAAYGDLPATTGSGKPRRQQATAFSRALPSCLWCWRRADST